MIWMDTFYQEHSEWSSRQYMPVIRSFMQVIADQAADETEASIDDLGGIVERCARSYSSSLADSQAKISQYRLKEKINQAQAGGEDIEKSLIDEVESWRDSRPAEISQEHSMRAANAIAKTVYIEAGRRTLVWVTMGSKSCAHCQSMDGRTVSTSKPFLAAGEDLKPEDAEPMTVSTTIGHPPLHGGCECMITAGE